MRGSQPTIFDISKVTLKLGFDDIKLLTIKTLNSKNDISKNEVKTLSNENQPESTDGYSQLINEDASYGLKTRSKGNKLSFDQISFLTELMKNHNIPTNDIRKYKILLRQF